ncbi:MAG: FecR family protein [Steroidobacteraceae bacterium]
MVASILLGLSVWWNVRTSITALTLPGVPTASSSSAGPALIRDASTGIGERSILVLADGSKVTLNTASAVRVDYRGHERRVTLVQGEAFFDVAKNRMRPFVVSAGSRDVIAVGTAFDVRLHDRQIKVTLVEGKVRIDRVVDRAEVGTPLAQPVSAVVLEAGSALVAQEGGTDHVERLDAARATSWLTGKLVFDGERLIDVVAEMNRYSHERLEIADPALNARKVSGVFDATGGSTFAKALEAYGIARVTRQTATTIVLNSPR